MASYCVAMNHPLGADAVISFTCDMWTLLWDMYVCVEDCEWKWGKWANGPVSDE